MSIRGGTAGGHKGRSRAGERIATPVCGLASDDGADGAARRPPPTDIPAPSACRGGALSPPGGSVAEGRADVGAGPYFTLQAFGMNNSPNCSTAYLSVIPDM